MSLGFLDNDTIYIQILMALSPVTFLRKHLLTDYLTSLTWINARNRPGLKINCVENDGLDPTNKQKLVHKFQSLIGGLNWLSIDSLPDICMTYSLLSQFNANLSQGNMDDAKYILFNLKHTASYGIWFRQGEN